MEITESGSLDTPRAGPATTSAGLGEKITASEQARRRAAEALAANRRGPQVLQSRQARQLCFEFYPRG
jgi:hypothetical protein